MSHFFPEFVTNRIQDAHTNLKYKLIKEYIPLNAEISETSEPVPFKDRLTLQYHTVTEGTSWGKKPFDCAWLHLTGTIPENWKGKYVVINIDIDGEVLLFAPNGDPIIGLTNGSVFEWDCNKDIYHAYPNAKGGEKIDIWLDAAANGLLGGFRSFDPSLEFPQDPSRLHGWWGGVLRKMRIAIFDHEMWLLRLDMEVLLDLTKALPEKSPRRIQVLRALQKAVDILETSPNGIEIARKHLKETAFSVGPNPASAQITAIGHAHIDTAWLWPYRETIRKVGRTFSSQIANIKRYPEFRFGASQAQLYKYCKETYPTLYAKIKDAVRDNKWEIQGGMWVEADTNLPSTESLIRQFLLGMHYFKKEFDKIPQNLWLPDVFGYNAQLPQILRICGISFFLTQKLSWNIYNTFPHNTFIWQGIDGSDVIVHFPPEDTYNASMLPSSLIRGEENNKDSGIINNLISLTGIGDGGGGTHEEHIERARRAQALNGCPRVHFDFAQNALNEMATHKDELDRWVGELYFERHRGTYTTQANQKRLNRRSEEAMKLCEILSALADTYPHEEITEMWRTICLCQFHDVIPGSAIHRVYEESTKMLEEVLQKAKNITQTAAQELLQKDPNAIAIFNPSATTFEEAIEIPNGTTAKEFPCQKEGDKTYAYITASPLTFTNITILDTPAEEAQNIKVTPEEIILENPYVRYSINPANLILNSGYDKEYNKDFITKPANIILLNVDMPYTIKGGRYDNWDIENDYKRLPVATPQVTKIRHIKGPIRQQIIADFTLGNSTFQEEITLNMASKRLTFHITCNWQENHKIARVTFPVNLHSPHAIYEIQGGLLERPTNANTTWDYAKFEVPAQRFADLSDHSYGLSLLNDSKYGYSVTGNEISLTLLRAPTDPDPIADRGHHSFTYAILPHKDSPYQNTITHKHANILNQGIATFLGYKSTTFTPPITLEDGIELLSLKKPEDGTPGLIIRISETQGLPRHLTLPPTTRELLATELSSLPFTPTLHPFEIKTLHLQ